MKNHLQSLIRGKKVGILGYGREGRATLKILKDLDSAASLTVIDVKDVKSELPDSVNLVSGEGYLDCLDSFDLVFKTPGIVLPKSVSSYSCSFTSETDEFIKSFKSQVIGITGTKGKSTTSSLLYHVLKESGKNVLLAGNIGVPVFDIIDQIDDQTIIVIELSCHQLEYATVSPHTSVLLNIYEDHLDHYGTREKYGKAKLNIYLHQDSKDTLYTTKETMDEWGAGKSKVIYPAKEDLTFSDFSEISGVSLRGKHNLLNAAFVYDIAKEYGVSDEDFIKCIGSFKTLPHRLEYIGNIDGIEYYDDSISTTVKSAISAVESIENATCLLVGGMERNIEYDELIAYVKKSKLKYLICMYESGRRIYEMYGSSVEDSGSPKAYLVDNLEEAVAKAKEKTSPGEAVLLSPAAASYGYFKNFEERGDIFCELVKKTV